MRAVTEQQFAKDAVSITQIRWGPAQEAGDNDLSLPTLVQKRTSQTQQWRKGYKRIIKSRGLMFETTIIYFEPSDVQSS